MADKNGKEGKTPGRRVLSKGGQIVGHQLEKKKFSRIAAYALRIEGAVTSEVGTLVRGGGNFGARNETLSTVIATAAGGTARKLAEHEFFCHFFSQEDDPYEIPKTNLSKTQIDLRVKRNECITISSIAIATHKYCSVKLKERMIMKHAVSSPVVGLLLGIFFMGCADAEVSVEVKEKDQIVFTQPFTTDGCSMFPDGTPQKPTLWQACCIRHDKDYFVGGDERNKKEADEELRQCVAKVTNSDLLADAMHLGVTLGGVPTLPTSWRWGYGRGWSGANEKLGYATPPDEGKNDQLKIACQKVAKNKKDYAEPNSTEQQTRKKIEKVHADLKNIPGFEEAYKIFRTGLNLLKIPDIHIKIDHFSYTAKICETRQAK